MPTPLPYPRQQPQPPQPPQPPPPPQPPQQQSQPRDEQLAALREAVEAQGVLVRRLLAVVERVGEGGRVGGAFD